MRKELAICGLLLMAVAVVFGQTLGHGFVNFDDPEYVFNNPHVTSGLSVENTVWAFTSRHADNWHPLTWLSHMLDCQLYGLAPSEHHFTNVLLHAATAILLFLVLRRMTGDFWPSAFVAAVFAIHPLRAESVVWVAERKDVLSGLFFMLTLAAYLGYVRRPFSLARYLMVIALFVLGLTAKPMLVTLPFVLLLLDYWPLGRMTRELPSQGDRPFPWRILVEKVPLLVLSAASAAVTLWAQQEAIFSDISLPVRIRIAALAYVDYVVQLFYPAGLALMYPLVGLHLPVWKAAGTLLTLAAICLAVVVWRRRRPYLMVGWLWYMGMLVPVIGLVQVGSQAMADRYTYLPQIGLCIALAWAVADLARSWPYQRLVCGVAAVLVVAILMGCAWRQAGYWRNSETLWTRTLDCTGPNAVAYLHLGDALAQQGRAVEATTQYRNALETSPNYAEAHHNLAVVLVDLGSVDEAIGHYRRSLELQPDDAEAHNDLGALLADRGLDDDAALHFRRALEINPDYAEAHNNLGRVLAEWGRTDEAVRHYRRALEIKPDYATAHNNLGAILLSGGQKGLAEAIVHFRKATQLDPHDEDARRNLGVALHLQEEGGGRKAE